MSYVFFMDESGQDHGKAPYEVRGGLVINQSELWPLFLAMRKLEYDCFGDKSSRPPLEIKGGKLLKKRIYKFAGLEGDLPDELRKQYVIEFLNLGDQSPRRNQFAAYGQSCLKFIDGIFVLLNKHNAKVFASIIPGEKGSSSREARDSMREDYILRKDLVFLWERYFYFLREKSTNGLLILDETEKQGDTYLQSCMDSYFMRTEKGRTRAKHIVPIPLFIESDMNYGIQIADVLIYCINWAYREEKRMNKATRTELQKYADEIKKLVYVTNANGNISRSIAYIPDPYTSRKNR